MKQIFSLSLVVITGFLFGQKDSFTVMTYNLMYYKAPSAPCSQSLSYSAKDAAFKTVFKYVEPDILCVNELGAYSDNSAAESVLENVINTDGETDFMSAEFSNAPGSSITNMIFFDSTRFALKSQDAVRYTPSGQSMDRVIDFYRLYYKEPGLSNGDTTFFTVMVAHLKAGNSSQDANEREEWAEAAMEYLANEVSDENVILAGDMNFYSSNEDGYEMLTEYTVAKERFIDPGPSGLWHNNSTYASVHTQSTHYSGSGCYSGGGMDDRFDFIMHSNPIENESANMNYVDGSMKAVGNDGSHFNSSINYGGNSAVPSAVAQALYDFSDHLPVIAQYEVAVSGISLEELPFASVVRCNNPFGETLRIKKAEPNEQVEIFIRDIRGKIVWKGAMAKGKTELNLETFSWKAGIYLMTISDEKGKTHTRKLIKESNGI